MAFSILDMSSIYQGEGVGAYNYSLPMGVLQSQLHGTAFGRKDPLFPPGPLERVKRD